MRGGEERGFMLGKATLLCARAIMRTAAACMKWFSIGEARLSALVKCAMGRPYKLHRLSFKRQKSPPQLKKYPTRINYEIISDSIKSISNLFVIN